MFRREHIEEDDIANLSMKNSKDYFYDGKIYTLGVKFFDISLILYAIIFRLNNYSVSTLLSALLYVSSLYYGDTYVNIKFHSNEKLFEIVARLHRRGVYDAVIIKICYILI